MNKSYLWIFVVIVDTWVAWFIAWHSFPESPSAAWWGVPYVATLVTVWFLVAAYSISRIK